MTTIPGRGRYTEQARAERLDWLRATTGAPLPTLGAGPIDAASLTGNTENYIGTVAVPIGLAGPLLFHGHAAVGPIVAPLATTEGALIASASRGAAAITRAGGVTTRVLAQRMTRAPVFEFAGLGPAVEFVTWIQGVRPELDGQVRQVSRYTSLVSIEPFQIGRAVHLLLGYETSDAAGQNMTTIATARICQWIGDALARLAHLRPDRFYLEGQLSGDKKVTHLSMIGGRGIRVTAECHLDRETIATVLKSTPEHLDAAYRVTVLAAQQAGMIGFNVNVANILAAMFIATGQDVACVHESGVAIFSIQPEGDGLRGTMLLPSLIVGTVGGGTHLPQQQDLLKALGCDSELGSRRLAEIICGFALALDLSTAAAITGGQFADAHQRLGRPSRVRWLTHADLAATVAGPLLKQTLPSDAVTVHCGDAVNGAGILSDLAARGERRKLLGLFPLQVDYTGSDGAPRRLDLVAKVKPLDAEVLIEMGKLASLGGRRIADAWERHARATAFAGSHRRETAIYRSEDPALVRVLPRCYGVHEEPAREAFVVLMEDLRTSAVLFDQASMRPAHIDAALDGIAAVHAAWLGRDGDAAALGAVDGIVPVDSMELWRALAEHNAAEHPTLVDDEFRSVLGGFAASAEQWTAELAAMPRTLVHHDFNPRNIALRRDSLVLVAYDWELAAWHVPQRDLAELLAFVLTPATTPAEVAHYVDRHRASIAARGGAVPDAALWRQGYRFALRDFALTRLQLYLMGHTHREYPFLDQVVRTVRRLCEIEANLATARAVV